MVVFCFDTLILHCIRPDPEKYQKVTKCAKFGHMESLKSIDYRHYGLLDSRYSLSECV